MCLTSGRDRLVSRDNVSQSFVDYTEALNAQRFRYKLFTEYDSHYDYASKCEQGMEIVKYSDVETYLVSIRWQTIAGYYNAIPVRRYGAWSRMNRNRLLYIDGLNTETCRQLVEVGSANSWKLMYQINKGYYIKQVFNPDDTIIDVINKNYEITQVIGKLSRIHANA